MTETLRAKPGLGDGLVTFKKQKEARLGVNKKNRLRDEGREGGRPDHTGREPGSILRKMGNGDVFTYMYKVMTSCGQLLKSHFWRFHGPNQGETVDRRPHSVLAEV